MKALLYPYAVCAACRATLMPLYDEDRGRHFLEHYPGGICPDAGKWFEFKPEPVELTEIVK